MTTIYLDKEFCCYAKENSNTVQSVETDFFDNKCAAFIEGYRYIPSGQSWTRSDGEVFNGEMVSPIKDYSILESVQKLYEENSAIQSDTDAMLVDYEYRLVMLELGLV